MAESVMRSPTDPEVRGSNPALDILRIKFLDFAKSSGRSRTINGLWCRWCANRSSAAAAGGNPIWAALQIPDKITWHGELQ